MDLTSTKERVRRVLSEFPETRDNDNLLVVHIWSAESSMQRTDELGKFIDLFVADKLTKTESIRRVRQKLQELYPGLRGKVYKGRRDERLSVVHQLNHIK